MCRTCDICTVRLRGIQAISNRGPVPVTAKREPRAATAVEIPRAFPARTQPEGRPWTPEICEKLVAHWNSAQFNRSARVGPAAREQFPNERQANAVTGRIYVPSCIFRLIVNAVPPDCEHCSRSPEYAPKRMLESRPLGVRCRSTYSLEVVDAGPQSDYQQHTSLSDSGDECSTAAPEGRWPVDHVAEANSSTTKDAFLGEDSLVQRYRHTSTPGDSLPPSTPMHFI